jgi:hypothetical protein
MFCVFRYEKVFFRRSVIFLFVCITAIILLRVAWIHRLNSGVAAFKYEEYAKAKSELEILAKLGDSTAQDRMVYILGLGLGQEPGFLALHAICLSRLAKKTHLPTVHTIWV